MQAYRAALDLSTDMGRRVFNTGRRDSANWQDALSEYTELDLPEADEIRTELAQLTCTCET